MNPAATSEPADPTAELPRRIGLWQATALNMIDMVGIGPFLVLPTVMGLLGPRFLWAWVAGALLSVFDGLIWSELGAAHPTAGGSYRFLKLAYGEQKWGRLLSFLYVWQTLVQAPLVIASGSIGFSQYAAYLIPALQGDAGAIPRKAVSGLVVIALTILCYRRVEGIGRIGVLLWVGVLGTLGWLIWGGLSAPAPLPVPTGFDLAGADLTGPGSLTGLAIAAALGAASVKTIYSYLGYYNVCHLGGEIENPSRVIPRAILLAIAGITGLYLLLNVAVARVIPWQEAQHSDFIVSLFIERRYGPAAAVVATGLILWVAFASLFAVMVGYARIPYAAAADGQFFRVFARLHPRGQFPYVVVLTLGAVAFVFSLLFRLAEVIAAIIAMRVVVQFIMQAIGAWRLRRRAEREGRPLPFRMPLFPLPILIAVTCWLAIFASTGQQQIISASVMISLGVVAFLLKARAQREWPLAPPETMNNEQ